MGLQFPHTLHALLDLGNDLRLTIQLVDLKIRPELLDERQERTRVAEGDAVALNPGDLLPGLRQGPPKLQHQARFAHAGLASDTHHLPPASFDLTEALTQRRQLPLAADQRRQTALHRHVKARAVATGPQDLEGVHRGTALHRDLAQVARLEEAYDHAGASPH